MSADGDFVRTMQWTVLTLQSALDQDKPFAELTELFKDAARLVELSDKDRVAWLWADSSMTEAESAELSELWAKFEAVSNVRVASEGAVWTTESDKW